MITDTHCHLYEESFVDIEQVILESRSRGVHRFVIPNVDTSSIDPLNRLLATCPHCYGAMGLHPTYVGKEYKVELDQIKKELDKGDYVAVGEIGIDLHWSKEFIEEQKKAFAIQIEWALEKKLPIIIHSREAFAEVFELLSPYKGKVKGVFHSFTGGNIEAERIVSEFDFMVGINGVVTYKNSNLKNVLKNIPLSHLVLETDSPYLSPVPHRGKRNDPSNLSIISSFIAQIYGIDQLESEAQIESNVIRLFGF